jgi:hypothetical protein
MDIQFTAGVSDCPALGSGPVVSASSFPNVNRIGKGKPAMLAAGMNSLSKRERFWCAQGSQRQHRTKFMHIRAVDFHFAHQILSH